MTNAKEIKKRSRSISSIKKITKAMELVSAAKMRRAVDAVLKTRTYANLSWETLLNIVQSAEASKEETKHPLLEQRLQNERELIILFVSNRGLCGGFNSAIIAKAIAAAKKHSAKTDFVVIGRKAEAIYRNPDYDVVLAFDKSDQNPAVGEIASVARKAMDSFLNKKYDKVLVAYTDFVNTSKQVPRIRQLLPIDVSSQDEFLGVLGKSEKLHTDKTFIQEKQGEHLVGFNKPYLFKYEPSAAEVLDSLLPRLIETQLYQALLESNASEHSARMAAMHQAAQAADDLAVELTLSYNKARQAAITAEIAEISGGAAGLLNT